MVERLSLTEPEAPDPMTVYRPSLLRHQLQAAGSTPGLVDSRRQMEPRSCRRLHPSRAARAMVQAHEPDHSVLLIPKLCLLRRQSRSGQETLLLEEERGHWLAPATPLPCLPRQSRARVARSQAASQELRLAQEKQLPRRVW